LNLTGEEVNFINPKEIGEANRESKTSGLYISLIIMGVIGSFSFMRLITIEDKNGKFVKKNKNTDLSKNNLYQKLNSDYSNKENNIDSNYNNTAGNLNVIDSSNSNDKINSNLNINNNYNSTSASEDLNKIEKINLNKNKNNNSCFNNFLRNFDLIKNAKTIFNIDNTNQTFEYLRVFDGIRFLSTCWVLWGHVFFLGSTIGLRNFYDIVNKTEKFIYCILTSAVISVDVFFYMSGFLLYFNLKKYLSEKTPKFAFFFTSLLQRYIRLLPFYLIGIFIVTNTLPFLVDGPRNQDLAAFLVGCEKYWWHNLFYMQNFFSATYAENANGIACIPHSWYLCDDMLYFVFSTIIILFVYNKRMIKNLIFVLVFIASSVYQIIKCLENNYTQSFKHLNEQKGDFFNDFYIQPLARITPYLLGILYCELFFETDVYKASLNLKDRKNEEENSVNEKNYLRRFNLYVQANNNLCLFILLVSLLQIFYGIFVIWFPQNYELSQNWQVFFITFNKIFFINGLGSLIHLLFLQKFEIIKNILSWSFFSVMSRITYGVYILHFYVLMVFLYNSDNSFKLDMVDFSFYAIGLMAITLLISFIVGLLYESPVINMLKTFKKLERKGKNDVKIEKTPEE